MARPALFPTFPGRTSPPASIRAAKVAAAIAVIAACVSLIGWIAPSALNSVAFPMMITGFFIAFVGMGGAIFMTWGNWFDRKENEKKWRDRLRFWSGLWWILPLFQRVPRRLVIVLGFVCAVAITSSATSLAETGGYSQNPPNFLSRCPWSIGTNHGFTNLCVTHSRWLATGYEFERSFIGFLALFLAVECLMYVSQATLYWGDDSTPAR